MHLWLIVASSAMILSFIHCFCRHHVRNRSFESIPLLIAWFVEMSEVKPLETVQVQIVRVLWYFGDVSTK
jgi:hypothetical protein